MNEMTQPYKLAKAAPVSWFQFATRHRASIASLVVLVFPLVMPFTALAVNILIYGLYALGFNLVYGYLGLLSFGHAALLGTGAYLCGIAIVHFALPWYAAIVIGILGGLLMAAMIGVLAIRTRGIYFAMVTMALSQCVYYLFYQAVDWTGGENGLRGINVRVINVLGLRLDFIDPLTFRPDSSLGVAGLLLSRPFLCSRAYWPRRSEPLLKRCAKTRPAPRPPVTTSPPRA